MSEGSADAALALLWTFGAGAALGLAAGAMWRGRAAEREIADERDRADALEAALGGLSWSVRPETTGLGADADGAPPPRPQRKP